MAKSYTKPCVHVKKWLKPKIWEFYRVPADNRDLNYAQYFSEETRKIEDYHSHNTEAIWCGRNKLLVQLPLIKKKFGEDVAANAGLIYWIVNSE
jgi:UDP-glucose 4-epimerase